MISGQLPVVNHADHATRWMQSLHRMSSRTRSPKADGRGTSRQLVRPMQSGQRQKCTPSDSGITARQNRISHDCGEMKAVAPAENPPFENHEGWGSLKLWRRKQVGQPAKSLGLQGLEWGLEHLGWEGAGHVIPFVDYGFVTWDISDEVRENNKFKKKLKDAQQRECSCETKSYGQVSKSMSLKRETPEPIEQRDTGNVRHPHSRSAILRKRILAFFLLMRSDVNDVLLPPIRVPAKCRGLAFGLFMPSCRSSERCHEIYRCEVGSDLSV